MIRKILEIFPGSLNRIQFVFALILSTVIVAIPATLLEPHIPRGSSTYLVFGIIVCASLALLYGIVFAKRFINAGKSPYYSLPVIASIFALSALIAPEIFADHALQIIEKASHMIFLIMFVAALAVSPSASGTIDKR